VLFSSGHNIETCKIIEANFLTLHCLPHARFFAGQGGPNGKYANATSDKCHNVRDGGPAASY